MFDPKFEQHLTARRTLKWAMGPRAGYLILGGLILASLAACTTFTTTPSSPQATTPFQAFEQSVAQLQQGTEKALANIETTSEERFIREALRTTAVGDPSVVEQLRLNVDEGSALSWSTSALFLKLEQFKEGARKVTAALVAYSQLIVRLASPELLPEETFTDLATELNANAYEAVRAISDTAEPSASRVALFSTAASGFARAYIESRRSAELLETLKANQGSVEYFSDQMREGIELAAVVAGQEYTERSQDYFRRMIASSGGPASDSERRAAIDELIQLNRAHIRRMDTLNSLHQAFGQIANAHQELIRAAASPELKLTSIIALLEEGKRLETSYDLALASNEAKAVQAVADQAMAEAGMLEAEADAARLRAASAAVQAVSARAEADVDPLDEEKKSRADDLERLVQELRDDAAARTARAEEARRAAIETQNRANDIKKKLLEIES